MWNALLPTSPTPPTTCTKKQSNNYNVPSPHDSHYLALLCLPHGAFLWPKQISPSYMDSVIQKIWLDLDLIQLHRRFFSLTVEILINYQYIILKVKIMHTEKWLLKLCSFSNGYQFCTKNYATKLTNVLDIVHYLTLLRTQYTGYCTWGGERIILLCWTG